MGKKGSWLDSAIEKWKNSSVKAKHTLGDERVEWPLTNAPRDSSEAQGYEISELGDESSSDSGTTVLVA